CLLLFRAGEITVRSLGVRSDALVTPIALCGAWLSGFGYAVWFQAIRPEVYALQALVSLFAMERLAAFESRGGRDPRPLYAATLAVGLGLANHHVMAFFMFPALAFSTLRAAARTGLRPLLVCTGLGLLGLCVYAYLPVRAARHPLANFGDPRTLARLYWVVSAQVYTRYMGAKSPQPLSERYADALVELVDHMHGVFLLLALFGAYVGLRKPESRRICGLWLACALPMFGIRPWLTALRGNPDAIAYMTSGFAAVAVLASAAIAAAASFAPAGSSIERRLRFPLWAVAALVLALGVGRGYSRFDLSRFHATDLFDDYRERDLPTRSVVVATTPQTVFRHLELAATDVVRPDIEVIPVPFLRYPGVAEAVVRRYPDLKEIVAAFLGTEQVSYAALSRLAERRPVLTELDTHLPPDAFRTLLPMGLLFASVQPDTATAMLTPAALLQGRVYQRIERDLGAGVSEVETSRQLLWLHYMDAVFYAARGERAHADASLRAALRLQPQDLQLRALQAALADPAQPAALDVRPFLAFGE
ncbi:MAG: protein O-mannosyl-transferase family, partial [Polyangiales bacterium]